MEIYQSQFTATEVERAIEKSKKAILAINGLAPDENGNITIENAEPGTNTLVVETLPDVGDVDIDYLLKTSSGCFLQYKWINGSWWVSSYPMYMGETLPTTDKGDEFTDYYILNEDKTSYIHYRFIGGEYKVIGGVGSGSGSNSFIGTALPPTDEANENTDYYIKSTDGTYYIHYRFIGGEYKVIGGVGGGTAGGNLTIERVTQSPLIATPNDKILISFKYSSTDSDGETLDGTYTWKLGNSILSSGSLVQGINTFDMTEHVFVGTQKFILTVVDDAGNTDTKSWTVQVVDIRLESSFSDRIKYPAGKPINFSFTPYGSVSKTVHFILDGKELDPMETSVSGVSQSYTLPEQAHGAHLLECYMTATINNMDIETNHIFKDIIWFDEESTVPVIGCIYRSDYYGKVSAKQFDTTNISTVIFDPTTGNPTITKIIDGNITTDTITTNYDTFAYKTAEVGDHTIIISCGETSVTIIMDIEKLDIDIVPITANLAFDFNPTGLSNTSDNRLWKDSTNPEVNMTVSDNFDWNNGGYQIDSDGNQYFCIKSGTRAIFNYNLFAQDAKLYGAEFKVIFKTTNVKNINATFLSCESDSTVVGLEMKVHEAYIKSSAETLYSPYSEDDIIEFEYNINTLDTEDANATSVILTYEDGVPFRPMIYDNSHRLHQYSPVPITVGSDDCDVYIYRMKAYTSALTDSDILSNFIADARDSDTMINRYRRNQIYNENNILTPESVAAACPQLKIVKIDCPYFTQDKNEFIKNTSIEVIHKGGDATLDNWKVVNAYHSGQGTTSNEYGEASRNIDILFCFDGNYTNKKITYDPNYISQLTMGDGTTYDDGTGKITLTRNSVPVNYLNIKVNVASSENANNALLAKRFNEFLPYQSVANKNDPRVKNTMEFVNCVVFLRENSEDISTHREFADTNWHFYSIGNIGDSKKTDVTRTNDPTDHKEFVVEIADNTLPNSTFDTGVTDENGAMVYPISKSQWVPGNPKYDSLYNSWGDTYEFRYEHEDISDEESEANIQVWRDMYEWVITSTDEEFVNEFDHWFIKDSATYFYLFTERYTMIDNRAKNTFWHYSKVYDTPQFDGDTGYRFDFWDYDNDTALGINNTGELKIAYGKEDIDYRTDGEPSSGYIFNAAESVFFRRMRYLMHADLAAMYQNRESANAWNSNVFINEFDAWQEQFPEELWRLNIQRIYWRTYKGISIDNSIAGDPTPRFLKSMLNGRKKYQRRQFTRDQDIYIGTRYLTSSVKADQIMVRCNTPVEAVVKPDYTLRIVPFSDMYISVLFGNMSAAKQVRAKAGMTYEIICPLTEMDDTAILIYAASRIQALDDLSACYIDDNDFSKASKLQKLTIGNSTEGYSNVFLESLNLGNNPLLEYLDIRNCPSLVGSLNLSTCTNLESLYAEGTSITGIVFATNGKIELAHLPDTINNITMKNLYYLTDFDVSYDNLESLVIENSVIDAYGIVEDAADTIQTLRLVGVDWTVSDTIIMNQLLKINSSYISGSLNVTGLIRSQELVNYETAWPDLKITYVPENLVPQYAITYVNADANKTELCKIYVDQGTIPPDPYATGLITKPTMESDEQYDYEFDSWDDITAPALAARTVVAVYTKTVRTYTVNWYSKPGKLEKSVTAKYGAELVNDTIPTNTDDEAAYIYNIFTGWDKSTGFIRGDMDVYAVWGRSSLPEDGKDLQDMTPAEIFAVTTSGETTNYFNSKDHVDITLGHDFDFSNVHGEVIADNLYFDGKTAKTTDIKLFGPYETSFTIAIDLRFTKYSDGDTLLSCFEENGSEGFRIRYNGSYPNIQWGDVNVNVGQPGYRDMIVLRHIKGENTLYVYASNASGSTTFSNSIFRTVLTRSRSTNTESSISLGAVHFITDDGYDYYGTGMVYWCKVWFDDLGDANARKLAAWPHEKIRYEYYGTGLYRLAGGGSKRTNASFIPNNLPEDRRPSVGQSGSNTNAGGWESSTLRSICNSRFKDALPTVWQAMLKQVIISTNGDTTQGSELITTEDYVYPPSYNDFSEITIPWMTTTKSRIKFNRYIIPDDATYYTDSYDPKTDGSYNVKVGDIWDTGGYYYILVSADDINRLGLTVKDGTAISDVGGWVISSAYWTRSPDSTWEYAWYSISQTGALEAGYLYYTSALLCPCISI